MYCVHRNIRPVLSTKDLLERHIKHDMSVNILHLPYEVILAMILFNLKQTVTWFPLNSLIQDFVESDRPINTAAISLLRWSNNSTAISSKIYIL